MGYGYSRFSVIYHNVFDFPLKVGELEKWTIGQKLKTKDTHLVTKINSKSGFYYVKGREEIIERRKLNRRHSENKLKIAKKAARLLSKIPTVKFVGITGALAMMNAGKNSDIDLMVISKKNTLWTTRVLVYVLLLVRGYELRRPKQSSQKDKLCLNIWLDEKNLVWDKKDRNIYTAHEIAQVIPAVDKNKTYEKFLYLNRWILAFWPKSVKIRNSKRLHHKLKHQNIVWDFMLHASNLIAFKMQYFYMKRKITRETITITRALFHPKDWRRVVEAKLLKTS